MLTRHDLADLSRSHEDDLVLSVYVARDGSDPGSRTGWKLRLDGALGTIRAGLERESPEDLKAFERASELVTSGLDAFGRVLPHEGWTAFATADDLVHSEVLPFAPPDLVRWRQGVYAAPYVRAFKSKRPVVLALVDRWRARIYRYEDGRASMALELEESRTALDAADVGMSKRASSRSGMRGETRTDYTKHRIDENATRFRHRLIAALLAEAGEAGGVALGGAARAVMGLRKELEEKLAGRIVEIPELTVGASEAEIAAAAAEAASELTRSRQARLWETCTQTAERGSAGWNRTYRALAAGAVDTLLIARNLIESSPDDAERLVRMALAQGAEVEELGDELGARLWAESDGVAARLRFRMAL
jgi:hypothetical protein